MKTTGMASAFTSFVMDRPHLQHAAVRLGLWLVGVAERTGEDEIEVYMKDFVDGVYCNGVHIPGVNFRHETVRKSMETLEEEGFIDVRSGSAAKGPKTKIITLHPGSP